MPSKFAIVFRRFERFVGVDATIELGGRRDTIAVFEWPSIDRVNPAAEPRYSAQIQSEQMGSLARARVKTGEWVPFGIVGLAGRTWEHGGFQETSTRGSLLFDVSTETDDDCPVYFSPRHEEGVPAKVTDTVAALHISTPAVAELHRSTPEETREPPPAVQVSKPIVISDLPPPTEADAQPPTEKKPAKKKPTKKKPTKKKPAKKKPAKKKPAKKKPAKKKPAKKKPAKKKPAKKRGSSKTSPTSGE